MKYEQVADACDCRNVCVHGDRCLGGHANYPDWHWYHCEVCSPSDATYVWDGSAYIGTCRRCGFQLPGSRIPGRDGMDEHIRECRKAAA
ncbi:MAG TPA: hypothetical protein VHA75_13050 [Rugosimonospora sp.]|nr:hypothetical protein [Rugosimonospora sp.]